MSVCSKILIPLFCLLALVACSSAPYRVPVSSLTRPAKVTTGHHKVRTGETLYTIAWAYGQDYRTLAANNGISPPYLIYPGQKLRLGRGKVRVTVAKKTLTQKKQVRSSQSAKTGVKSPPYKKRPVKKKDPQPVVKGSVRWQWPVSGKVIARFSPGSNVYKGVDIGGRIGEPVRATAAGQVVYSGSGLSGYGNLVIIKHNSSYLSAYAHNRLLVVEEGDRVKAGQKIAELGSTGTSKPKLHFEIRRNGKPVDPLLFLPGR